MIHSLGGFEYSTGYNVEFVIISQTINYAVATFVFMASIHFVNVYTLSDKELRKLRQSCKQETLCYLQEQVVK